MTARTYIDVHILQTVPPSNINRDDTGSPKQALYGGVRRARVSSQAWKRATRKYFEERMPLDQLATRTKRISSLLAGLVSERGGVDNDAATRIAEHLLRPLNLSAGRTEATTAYLLFFGRPQLQDMADLVVGQAQELAALDDKALDEALKHHDVTGTLSHGHPIDVALFGRMVADIPNLNVDAAVQVAHAISTHAVEVEFDYYTAVDDENTKEETGAGMIGTVEYNSATLYRFATLGLHQLSDNLGGDDNATVDAVKLFLEAFVRSMPTGHQTSFAHRTLPSFVSVIVREDQPINLVSAFESPVFSFGAGLAATSVSRLIEELERATTFWGLRPVVVASCYAPPEGESRSTAERFFGPALPFSDAVERIATVARERLAL